MGCYSNVGTTARPFFEFGAGTLAGFTALAAALRQVLSDYPPRITAITKRPLEGKRSGFYSPLKVTEADQPKMPIHKV